MTPMFKGFLWICFIIVCFGLMMKPARANENYDAFRAIMDDKVMVHSGTCSIDEQGNIVKTQDEKAEVPCKSGVNPSDLTTHYIVIYDNQGEADRIVKLDTTTWKQEVIWRRGTAV